MARRIRPLRTALAALTSLVLIPLAGGTALARTAPIDNDRPTAAERKIEPKLLDRLEDGKKSVFWVYLDSAADLDAASKAKTKADKARSVYKAEREHAERTQKGLLKTLEQAGVEHTSYWIVNAVRVVGGEAIADKLARRSEVAHIDAEDRVRIPEPLDGRTENTTNAVEWNIDRINAPKVWEQFGVRGEGVVVANIDTGVDYQHPAVDDQYRGRGADGTYDHAYNWFDPAHVCPTAAPCDNNDHGTHTMGTMVGDDGADNKVGVAPGAKWIAAKGCESSSCSQASLLAAGQWVVAPTDLNGQNPRPDLAPDIVNNSWGSTVFNPWYKDVVASWRAAGIFPAFSNGNAGPGCNTSGSPGDYGSTYSSGAFDINNAIASFSSRGAGDGGGIKPNIAAPGVNIRSSVPGGGYDSFSGTSMASPHTAGSVALLWSASPALQGDVAQTQALLDQTAIDVDNTSCGGTAADNNVFGEGRLDVLAAVQAAPRGPLGVLKGTVTAAGSPVAGAKVVADGPIDRTTSTAADGTFTFPVLSVGDYAVAVTKFGYTKGSGDVTVTEGATTTRDFAIEQAPSAKVTGTVSSAAGPASGATVTVKDTPVTATADNAGHFEVTLPLGTYDLDATHPSRCVTAGTKHLDVTADTTADISLPDRLDTYGYACAADPKAFVAGEKKLALAGDNTTEKVDLPFPVPLYGKSYTSAWISTNGSVSFAGAQTSDINGSIPSTGTPNAALYPFWDDLIIPATGSAVLTGVVGTAPHRAFVVEWRDAAHWSAQTDKFTFSAVIGEDGRVSYHYKGTTGVGLKAGASATIGVENAEGTDAFQYSFNTAVLSDGLSIAFRTTKTGVVRGQVLDANDGKGVEGATVSVGSGASADTATTSADGGYIVQSRSGDLPVHVTAPAYQPSDGTVSVKAGDVVALTQSLKTGNVAVSKKSFEVVVPAGEKRTRAFELSNSGLDTPFTVTEDASWLSVTPSDGTLATGAKKAGAISVDTSGQKPGAVLTADVKVASQSGRSPVLTVPVKVVVPRYQAAIDTGSAGKAVVDALGDTWKPDQKYSAGSYGYQGNSSTRSTSRPITGTDDPKLYQNSREGMYEYRFDNVPNGTYTVELDFAELATARPNKRVFDVLAEGTEVLPSLDIALEAGSYAAVHRGYTVTVDDGVLNVRFVAHTGYGKPVVNALRVTERPDKS
ncbi:S8 family serine peptidase [Wenjunlia tyrosinilytica]|uniref:Alpha-amylase n=1 Tax=Wenjunlia tyrosinilytica TaxID=1544741 RepID=A0A917ZJ25_9ACTN|nr:S8 family serine peptidase [Wenjunlia tyrosinilytica]GGO83906.1 hypothetical protein GCM10012280_14150 [Wenjunlia tyrosinilytica]